MSKAGKRNNMKKLVLITILLSAIACNNSSKNFPFDEVTILHQSADMPAEYQRSYTIHANTNNIHVIVKGANNTILDTNIDNTTDQFAEYVKSYEYLDLGVATIDTTCKGCAIRKVILTKEGKEVFNTKWNNIDNHPALQRLVDVVINSVPGFGELLARKEK